MDILSAVRDAAAKRILFLPHAVRQMFRPQPAIATNEIRQVVQQGEVIENYPEDVRGHSCLILGFGDARRAIHVVCAPKDEYLAIITAYVPEASQWADGYRLRKTK